MSEKRKKKTREKRIKKEGGKIRIDLKMKKKNRKRAGKVKRNRKQTEKIKT